MPKESSVWRGDDPGFQTQATGNYPAKSDVADKDNIYLSDQGWVYRHFKSLDKLKYWDEIIWAGDVTNPPSANDPVDPFGEQDPDFLVGDGYQFISGPYPVADPDIGVVTINAAANGDINVVTPFALNEPSGAFAAGNTFVWTVDGPGTAIISTPNGTFTGNTPAEANTNITFPVVGQYNVNCLIRTSATASTGSMANIGFGAQDNVPTDTIGTVTVNGQATPQVGQGVTYTASHDGTAPQNDLDYTWTVTPNTGVTIDNPGDSPNQVKLTFTTKASVTSTAVKVEIVDTEALDSPQENTLTVLPHFVIGTPAVGGPSTVATGVQSAIYSVTFTGASNPDADDMTYAWKATPATGVTFDDATSATPKITTDASAEDTTFAVSCTVSSAKSDPSSASSAGYNVTAAA